MGFGKKAFFTIVLAAATAYLTHKYIFCCSSNAALDFTADKYWGRQIIKKDGQFPADDTKIRPFKVEYKAGQIEDLKQRLANTKYVEPLPDTDFHYGFPGPVLKKVVDHWQTKFDFNKTLKELNQFPHFITQIEGIDIHFIHIKPKQPKQVLLLVHGWPGSVYEYYKLIPLLSNDYELVVPSIPGYGWSEEPHKTGFSAGQASRVFIKLMRRLGHGKQQQQKQGKDNRYIYFGGDWGSVIGHWAALNFPEDLKAVHLPMLARKITLRTLFKVTLGHIAPSLVYGNEKEIQFDRGCLYKWFTTLMEESGYLHLQSTKPDTVGALLADSPAGLAAYILEKFTYWVNVDYINRPDGGLTERFTLDELLTNVLIYWINGNAPYSTRIYKETIPMVMSSAMSPPKISPQIKLGYTLFPHEPYSQLPRYFVEELSDNLVYYNIADRGSHFSSFEIPQLVASELRAFIQAVEKKEIEETK